MNNLIKESLIKLKQKNITSPELDLRILLKHASKKNDEIILSNLNVDNIDIVKFKSYLQKRINRQPIAKIIKNKPFWKNNFYVNNFVLDPRPETELIIEEVLNIYRNKNLKLKILDIGTGSGCIAVSLAKEFKNASITAIDISKEALEVAEKNLKIHSCYNQIQLKMIDYKNINVPNNVTKVILRIKYWYNDKMYKFLTNDLNHEWPPKQANGIVFNMPIVSAQLLDSNDKPVKDVLNKIKRYAGPRGDFYDDKTTKIHDMLYYDDETLKFDYPTIKLKSALGMIKRVNTENGCIIDLRIP